MSNTKLFLLIGTSLSFLPALSLAQCVATQDCATLGYTETSCNGGKGVKCPFGNKWVCLGANEEEVRDKLCQELGFTLTCTGTGYAGGAGSACGGKYNYCNCASGYAWKDGACQQQALNGAQGDLYYCNGKVVGVKTGDMDFYVAMTNAGFLDGWNEVNQLCQNYSFCSGKSGILPSKEQLFEIKQNKQMINSLLTIYGGEVLSEDDFYWSSSYASFCNCYYVVAMAGIANSDSIEISSATYANYVRAILVP